MALLGQMQLWEAAAVKVGLESLMVLALRTAEIFYRYYANRSLKPTRRVGMTPGGVER